MGRYQGIAIKYTGGLGCGWAHRPPVSVHREGVARFPPIPAAAHGECDVEDNPITRRGPGRVLVETRRHVREPPQAGAIGLDREDVAVVTQVPAAATPRWAELHGESDAAMRRQAALRPWTRGR